MPAKSLLITGRVQGVCFRANAQEKAKELGITGWVFNTEDGNVEIHAEGEESAIREFEAWCHKGPPSAQVESVNVQEIDKEGFSNFNMRF